MDSDVTHVHNTLIHSSWVFVTYTVSPIVFVLQLWLALASLCVLDQDHVDRLSSGRWMGKDGQQKQMVRMKNNSCTLCEKVFDR